MSRGGQGPGARGLARPREWGGDVGEMYEAGARVGTHWGGWAWAGGASDGGLQ